MRKFGTSALLLIVGCLSLTRGVSRPQPNPRHAISRTVIVEDGPLLCAGAAVGRHTIATAAHCYLAGDFQITLPGGVRIRNPEIVYRNEGQDLMLLRVRETLSTFFTLSRGASWGDSVIIVGHPDQNLFSMGEGVVAHPLRRIRTGYYTQISASTYLGGSGGPCVDAQGNLVGITSRVSTHFDATFVVHVRALRAALDMLP